ncbi:MAG: hypothetical protein H6Q90_6099 [Deltaproteobacteria bacterium]|nr:hypothetical protein [Deltaproteobacteria bacterium]
MSDPKTLKGLSDAEEAFFRAGIAATKPEPVETFADLDEGYRPRSLLRRLFSRKEPPH